MMGLFQDDPWDIPEWGFRKDENHVSVSRSGSGIRMELEGSWVEIIF
jgi:hypothetical protein